jgi:hypothetical protein
MRTPDSGSLPIQLPITAFGQLISNAGGSLKPLGPTPVDCDVRRTGTHSMMSKTPQANRLNDRIKLARAEAARLPAGPEKDGLLCQIEKDEVALRVI